MNRLKQPKYKNEQYGRDIRQSGDFACCVTGAQYAVVNHHIIAHGYSATGTKAPDHLQMALTHELHTELHDHGWKQFEEKYGKTQKQMVAETIVTAHAKGYLNIAKLDEEGHIPQWLWDEIENLSP